jgi:acetyl-CoA acyltransferase
LSAQKFGFLDKIRAALFGKPPSLLKLSADERRCAISLQQIIHSENVGFCAYGEGGALVESGATTLGGRLPINVSGGLLSKGHPVGATGAIQIIDLVTQLRGEASERQVENARLALAENGGGFHDLEEGHAW